MFIERIARRDDLQVADVELAGDLEDLDLHRIAIRRKGVAVAKDHGDEACALAGGGDGVAVHGGIGIGDDGQSILADDLGLLRIHDVGTELRRIGLEGLDRGAQRIDGGVPFRFIGGVGRHETLEQEFIGGGEQVQVEIVLARQFVVEGADEDEGAFGPAQRIEIDALLQVRRQSLEISPALVARGLDGGGQRGQAHGHGIERHGFLPRRIVQRDAILCEQAGGRGVGDGLLVEHLCARLPAHLREAEFRQGERLAHPQFRRSGGPGGMIDDGQRLIDLAGAAIRVGVDEVDVQRLAAAGGRAQEGQHGAGGRLRGQAHAGDEEARAAEVVELHLERGRAAVVRAAMNPTEAGAILEGEALVGVIIGHRAIGRHVGDGDDLEILGRAIHARAYQWQRQQRQRIRLHQQGARGGDVVEVVVRIRADHPVGVDRGPLVRGIGVGQEHEGLGGVAGAAGHVQIVAQRIDAGRQRESMFLVRVIARLRGVVLSIDAAGGLPVRQIIRAHAPGDDDLGATPNQRRGDDLG